MGYYTEFQLEIRDLEDNFLIKIRDENDIDKNENEELDKVLDFIKKEYKETDKFYGLLSPQSSKWYDYEKQMKELSKEFPKFLFLLNGSGEESGDIWREYFCNGKGKFQRAEFSFPDFDVKEFLK